ncbi:hypothetical protein SISNIDRAFT_470778 [Sistotremastrum niveocremeum HHB9708]|uniref:Uncharacterized protein n=1 Tax=Sistotremastrum niveocremeum HHB9708 TaxID=1314777 RepID=A0A164NEE7_9AGAM|nr:hypothetical protein SISNIDRAFT_470778 [Sistotremastrum niveocremeum HHB9708]
MSANNSDDGHTSSNPLEQRAELLNYYLNLNLDDRFGSSADTPRSRPPSITSATETSFDHETDYEDSENEEDELSELMGAQDDVNRLHRTKVVGTLAKDGSRCAICGMEGLENLTIIRLLDGESPSGMGIPWLQTKNLVPPETDRDSFKNLLCVCKAHGRMYNASVWRFVPSQGPRRQLFAFEELEVSRRQQAEAMGFPPPSRSMPPQIPQLFELVVHDAGIFAGPGVMPNHVVMEQTFELNVSPFAALASAFTTMSSAFETQPTIYFSQVQSEIMHLKQLLDNVP